MSAEEFTKLKEGDFICVVDGIDRNLRADKNCKVTNIHNSYVYFDELDTGISSYVHFSMAFYSYKEAVEYIICLIKQCKEDLDNQLLELEKELKEQTK